MTEQKKIKTIDTHANEIYDFILETDSLCRGEEVLNKIIQAMEAIVDSAPDGKHEKVLPNSFEAGHNLHCEYIKHWKKQMRGNNE